MFPAPEIHAPIPIVVNHFVDELAGNEVAGEPEFVVVPDGAV